MGQVIQNIVFWKNFSKAYLRSVLKSKKKQKRGLYNNLGILNPSIATSNLGDQIIYQSVYKNLRAIFKNDIFTEFPTQIYTSFDALDLMQEKDLLIVSGTNLLSSNLESNNQWKIHNKHKKYLKNKVALMGCGWWQYQEDVNIYTKNIYQSILSKDILHSVRDNYTLEKLRSIGVQNVVNTSCPTLWEMDSEKCSNIPVTRSEEVITTLTYYHKNVHFDFQMLKILSTNYNKVHLWIQGLDDLLYFDCIKKELNNIVLIPPTIEAFNEILKHNNVEYIGTRLHAGIRALQNEKRTLILAVDNRAFEISKDVNLNVITRESVTDILDFINGKYLTNIKLPIDDINDWKISLANFQKKLF